MSADSLIEKIEGLTSFYGNDLIAKISVIKLVREHFSAPDVDRVAKAIYDADGTENCKDHFYIGDYKQCIEYAKAAITAMGDSTISHPAIAETAPVSSSEISVVDEMELKETIRKVVSLICNTQQAAVKGMIDMIWIKISPYLRTRKPVLSTSCKAALINLIELKLHKEKNGADEYYLANKDRAWAVAKEVVHVD